MAREFTGNWVSTLISGEMGKGTSAKDIAALVAMDPKIIAAIQDGIDGDNPGVPGGSGADAAISNLCEVLQEASS